MSKIDPNESAFPWVAGGNDGAVGLTIRAEFAKAAMQGILAGCSDAESDFPIAGVCADLSVAYADALIAALNKETP